MEKTVRILECGPRDGWQNLKQMLSTEQKLRYIDGLFACGVEAMEITSFVSPKAIPQMADAAQVARCCVEKHPDKTLFALIPNFRGAQNAYMSGIRHVTYVISFSESHNKANINRTHDQSFEELARIRDAFPELQICIGLATTFGCPFEGIPEISRVVDFVGRIRLAGVNELYLADTIGIADPAQVRRVLCAVKEAYPELAVQVHFHDTRGLGMVNTLTALELGVDGVQTALGGLGGCPFAPGASGNLSTEDTVWMLNEMGYDTGIRFAPLLAAAKAQKEAIPGNYSGHHICVEKETPCQF